MSRVMLGAGLKYSCVVLMLAAVSGECAADGVAVAKPDAAASAIALSTEPNSTEKQTDAVGRPEEEIIAFPPPLCEMIAREAVAHNLPTSFFASLIWKESRLDPEARSPRGAAGIAQFMPKTASWRGLIDPYEPQQALREAASWLQDLRAQFGNWGLAAAAYNAGPQRVRDWLNGSGTLPAETRAYVAVITSLTTEEWARSLPPDFEEFTAREPNPCSAVPMNFAEVVPPTPLRKPKTVELPTTGPWGLQLVGDSSEVGALAAYRNLQEKHASILGNRAPLVLRSMGWRGKVDWVRIRVAESTRERAMQLCSKLKADGGSCLVVGN
jgi:hypothetical protein